MIFDRLLKLFKRTSITEEGFNFFDAYDVSHKGVATLRLERALKNEVFVRRYKAIADRMLGLSIHSKEKGVEEVDLNEPDVTLDELRVYLEEISAFSYPLGSLHTNYLCFGGVEVVLPLQGRCTSRQEDYIRAAIQDIAYYASKDLKSVISEIKSLT